MALGSPHLLCIPYSRAAAPSITAISPPCIFTGTAASLGAVVLCALPDAEEVRLAVDEEERDDALALLLVLLLLLELLELLDSLAELALAEEELALSLDKEAEELALALDSEAEADEALLLAELALADEAALAVEAAREAVLVAPWTWKPPEKL